MKITRGYLFMLIFLFAACSPAKRTVNADLANKGKVWALLWQQQAAEYKALCFQAYNIAKLRVDEAIKQPAAKPYAIVTDIDETILDNSPYDARRAINNQDFTSQTWKEWTAKGIADTVPGAPAFFKYAASKGVEIFYITNRDEDERVGTLKNLALYNMPDADNAHLLLKQSTSSKESRRRQVSQTHTIILFCGDNLADMDALYDNKPSVLNRTKATQQLMQQFGDKYIVLPNPAYGDFESAWYNFNYKLTPAQKDSIIKANLKTEN